MQADFESFDWKTSVVDLMVLVRYLAPCNIFALTFFLCRKILSTLRSIILFFVFGISFSFQYFHLEFHLPSFFINFSAYRFHLRKISYYVRFLTLLLLTMLTIFLASFHFVCTLLLVLCFFLQLASMVTILSSMYLAMKLALYDTEAFGYGPQPISPRANWSVCPEPSVSHLQAC
jgi:hypothetical protein